MNTRRILVADDDPTARLLMQAALGKAGFEVTLAEDGTQALQAFRAERFDMVLLDVDMPGMDGYAVCAALRKYCGDALPIVMVTGMDDTASIEAAFEAGATDFVAKPISWPLLGHRVRYVLRATRAAAALRVANARNAAMLDAFPDTLLRIDDANRVVELRAAPTGVRSCCMPSVGDTLSEAYPPAVATLLVQALQEARRNGQPRTVDFPLDCETGRPYHQEARVSAIDGGEALCLLRDITERKEYEARIHRLAYFDSLTGLANRRGFLERLEREIRRAQQNKWRLAVLFLDLDRFKGVNDTLGHAAGDALLQQAAERLRAITRPSDILAHDSSGLGAAEFARLGGDEFTVLLPMITRADDALVIAERIRASMGTPFTIAGQTLGLTTSIGIAVFPDDGQDAATLIKHADTAMYDAKANGRNGCRYYNPALTADAVHRVELEAGLRRALANDEFLLMYQPQLEVRDGCITTVEALVRWQPPGGELVPPLDFIPFAEECGLIDAIGAWVLQRACRDAAAWLQCGLDLRVAVNLSPMQFRASALLDTVRDALAASALPADRLELEITESALMADDAATHDTLAALRALGIGIALDDFGTGYSSLSYLKRLPLGKLKIDRSFVSGLPDDADNLAIVGAILALARHLGFSITAEGVETAAQAALLGSLEADSLQGYLFSRPVPAEEIVALASRRREQGQGTPCAPDNRVVP
jgi:diguanylate cyclase (GGDEF)-like protein